MKYDIFESISQRKYGENASQVSRMEEVTDFLFRSCANNETESCSSSEYGGNLYSEQSYVEKYAKENNCWYSIEDVFNLGTPKPSYIFLFLKVLQVWHFLYTPEITRDKSFFLHIQ